MFKRIFNTILLCFVLIPFIKLIVSAQPYSMIQITHNIRSQGEPWIAVNPSNPLILLSVWSDERYVASYSKPLIGFSFSLDGGVTWTQDDTIKYPEVSWRALYHIAKQVTAAFNRSGTAFCCYQIEYDDMSFGRGRGIVVSRTNNYDTTNDWSDYLIDHYEYGATQEETMRQFPFMAIDNTGILGKDGNIYVSWYNRRHIPSVYQCDTIKFCRSTDSGYTYSTPGKN